ncbi:MAG: hypothetical protein R3E12_18915 [Candidatus Eisenbacteria bacterium]
MTWSGRHDASSRESGRFCVRGSHAWKRALDHRRDGGRTHLLVDINPGGDSDPVFGPVINGVLFFSADDGVHGRELWKCDGTAAGTVMVKDIEPGPDGSAPSSFVATGSWVVSARATVPRAPEPCGSPTEPRRTR